MAALQIIGLCVLAAVLYGIVHDEVTARVCVEYFTIGHPQLFDTDSPTLLGLGWGIVSTWWVGLLLGAPLAFAALRGPRPRRPVRSLVAPIAMLLGCLAIVSPAAGLLGHTLARNGVVVLVEPMASSVPIDRHVPYIADLWAHTASYLAALVGGVVLVHRVWHSRGAVATDAPDARAPAEPS